jgi:hypothetical protein
MANSIDIIIKAKDNASKNLKKAQGSLDKFAGAARRAGAALTAIGVVGALAFKKLASAAIEQQAAEQALRVAVENTGESWDAVKDKINASTAALQKKTNFGDEEQMRALTLMTAITGDYEKALAALPLVMDTAAAKGRGMKMIAGTLTRVLMGQTDIADSLGVEFEKNTTFAERLAIGLGMVGGVAEAQADPFTQLGNDIGDVAQQFGKVLLPILTPIIAKIREWAVELQKADPQVVKIIMVVTGLGIAFAAIAGPILLLIGFLPQLIMGFTALGAVSTLALGPLGLIALALVAVGVAAFTIYDQARSATNEFERLRAEAEELEIEGARTTKNYNELAMKVQNVKLAQDKLNKSVAEHNELADAILATTGGIAFAMERSNKQARLFADNLESHVELAEEFKRVKQQTRDAEEAAERAKLGGPSLGLSRRGDPDAALWAKGGAAAMWWAGASGKPGGPTAEEQAIFDKGPGAFPTGFTKSLGGTIVETDPITGKKTERSAQVPLPSTSWQDPNTGSWNRVSIDPNTGQTVVYRQENAIEVTTILDGVQVGRSQGKDIAEDQANKSG